MSAQSKRMILPFRQRRRLGWQGLCSHFIVGKPLRLGLSFDALRDNWVAKDEQTLVQRSSLTCSETRGEEAAEPSPPGPLSSPWCHANQMIPEGFLQTVEARPTSTVVSGMRSVCSSSRSTGRPRGSGGVRSRVVLPPGLLPSRTSHGANELLIQFSR